MTNKCAECGEVEAHSWHNTFVPGEHFFVPAPSDSDEKGAGGCNCPVDNTMGHAALCPVFGTLQASAVQPPDDKRAPGPPNPPTRGLSPAEWTRRHGQPPDIERDEQRQKLVAQINAAPEPLRSYIQKLDTDADPAGDKFRLQLAEENVAILLIKVRELES